MGDAVGSSTEVPPLGSVGGGTFLWSDDSDPSAECNITGVASLDNWSTDRITISVAGQVVTRGVVGEGPAVPLAGTKWSLTLDVADELGHVAALSPTQTERCASPATVGHAATRNWCWTIPGDLEVLDCSCFVDASGDLQVDIVDVENPSCQPYQEGSTE